MYPRVSRYMKRQVYSVDPKDSLDTARSIMLARSISKLVVVDGEGRPIGVITAYDIARALAYKYPSRTIDSITVEDVMNTNIISITPSKSVKSAALIMLKHNMPLLPVVDDEGRIQGVLTKSGLLRAFIEHFSNAYKVEDVMRRHYTRAYRGHSIIHVAKLVELDSSGKVLVFDGDKLVGIIARRDIIFAFTRLQGAYKRVARSSRAAVYRGQIVTSRIYTIALAEDIMTPNPITVGPLEDSARAADIMLSEGIGSLPVVDNERVVGILTKLEILEALAAWRRRVAASS